MTDTFERSPQRLPLLAVLLYPTINVPGLLGDAEVRGTLVTPGDARSTADALRLQAARQAPTSP